MLVFFHFNYFYGIFLIIIPYLFIFLQIMPELAVEFPWIAVKISSNTHQKTIWNWNGKMLFALIHNPWLVLIAKVVESWQDLMWVSICFLMSSKSLGRSIQNALVFENRILKCRIITNVSQLFTKIYLSNNNQKMLKCVVSSTTFLGLCVLVCKV